MPVDSFKYLPRSIAAYYQTLRVERVEPIPWTPLSKPLNQCRFALVTTAGIYDKAREPPFDAGREKREPMWGDPTYRRILRDLAQGQMGTPRTLGVEVPFGHALGMPGDREMQMMIIRAALSLLEQAQQPGAMSEVEVEWPQPSDEARKDWQPLEASPIIKMMREQAQARAEGRRQET